MSDTESDTPSGRGGRKRGAIAVVAAAVIALATAAVGYSSQYHPMPAPPGSTVPQAPGAPGTGASAGPAIGTVVMVIRHGEKPDEDVSPLPGISVDGAEDDSSLTKVGWDRANALANVFDPAQGPVRPGLAKPGAIFAAGANEDGEGKRTRETIGPLAHKLGIQMNIDYGKGDEESLVAAATSQPGPTLICWQHGEIPAIAAAFGSVSPAPPAEWPDDRFDVVWTFTKTASGWRFAQVPEMALPADKPTTIGDAGLFSGRS